MELTVVLLLAAMPSLAWAATCRTMTKQEAREARMVAAGCPNSSIISGCACVSHGRTTQACPAPSTTLWNSTGKRCVTARPDKDSSWAPHDWHYPADYWTYCPPTKPYRAGSPPDDPGLDYWPEPGSYHCTMVTGQTHAWDASSPGYNMHWNTSQVGSEADNWCTKPGCYVDPCTCDKDDIASSSWFQGTEGPLLFYSYSMCGGGANTFLEAVCNNRVEANCTTSDSGCIWDAPGSGTNTTGVTSGANVMMPFAHMLMVLLGALWL